MKIYQVYYYKQLVRFFDNKEDAEEYAQKYGQSMVDEGQDEYPLEHTSVCELDIADYKTEDQIRHERLHLTKEEWIKAKFDISRDVIKGLYILQDLPKKNCLYKENREALSRLTSSAGKFLEEVRSFEREIEFMPRTAIDPSSIIDFRS